MGRNELQGRAEREQWTTGTSMARAPIQELYISFAMLS